MPIGRFRAGIGAVIQDPATARYLLLQRVADRDWAPGAWECVTGRVDQGEGFEDALRREVREEIGVPRVEIDFILGTSHFYRGPEDPDNELLGVIYHCSLPEAELALNDEHSALRWVTLDEARAFLDPDHPAEAWLLRVLTRAEMLRALLPARLIEHDRQTGFELG